MMQLTFKILYGNSVNIRWYRKYSTALIDQFYYARQHVMLSASLLRQRHPSICLSVRLSHCSIVSKRRNSGPWNLHCGLPQGLF